MNKDFRETISYLKKRPNWKEQEQMFIVISNLLYELGNERTTRAVYNREFKIGKLKITVDFRESN